jgi:pimeloyl-ACP methyl ester carboxylesterase
LKKPVEETSCFFFVFFLPIEEDNIMGLLSWIGLGIVVGVVVVSWWNPVRKIMFPAPNPSHYDDDLKSRLQKFPFFSTPIAYVIYRPRSGKSHGWIIYQHGNGCDMGSIDSVLRQYADELEWTIVSWEYPGYGLSTGVPNEKSINTALQLVIEHVIREYKVPLHQIVLHGLSIGTGPSVWAAGQYKVAGLILQSPYLSILQIGEQWYGKQLTRWVSRVWDPWNNQENIRRVGCKVLLLHGERDSLIPPSHSAQLEHLATPGSTRKLFKDTGHNWKPQIIIPALKDYLNSLVLN